MVPAKSCGKFAVRAYRQAAAPRIAAKSGSAGTRVCGIQNFQETGISCSQYPKGMSRLSTAKARARSSPRSRRVPPREAARVPLLTVGMG